MKDPGWEEFPTGHAVAHALLSHVTQALMLLTFNLKKPNLAIHLYGTDPLAFTYVILFDIMWYAVFVTMYDERPCAASE